MKAIIDTNVFIHAYANDAFTAECRQFLLAVEAGQVRAQLDPVAGTLGVDPFAPEILLGVHYCFALPVTYLLAR